MPYKNKRIGAIIACRMKSTRLRKKAIQSINGITSVERCINGAFLLENIDEVVLATSDLKEDGVLEKYVNKTKAKFWQGDPEDVIKRYIGASKNFKIDVIVRITADCPCPSPEITKILLETHFLKGADYSATRKCAVGSGTEVYNVSSLEKVINLLGEAKHSEYMTWYMRNNPDFFSLNIVDLPEKLVRDYRLTVDYQEDLDMFSLLFKKLEEDSLTPNLINIFKIMDKNPDISKINNSMQLIYRTNQELIRKLDKETKINL